MLNLSEHKPHFERSYQFYHQESIAYIFEGLSHNKNIQLSLPYLFRLS